MNYLMIFLKKTLSAFVSVGLAALLPVIAGATDIEPHVLPVQFSAKATGPATIYFGIYAEGSIPLTFENVSSSETSSNVAMLKPGKQYWADFQVSGSAEHWVSFVAPSGYQLYINGIPRDHFHHGAGAHLQDYFSIELRPIIGMGFLDAGTFSGIDIGQAIAWELGAGGLRSGHSVNRISFRQFDLTGNPASRDKLLYTPPIGTWQVNVIRDGPSTQTLRQIASPMKVLDFVDDVSGGYWVKYYNYDDTDLISGMYVPKSGRTPWKTIRVQSPAVGQLKITETEGSAVKVSLLTLTSQPPATLATGGTVTSSGGYTRHTFTTGGTFTPNIPLTVEYLVVAGGGGGGHFAGAGGGGGGAIVYSASAAVSSATSITVGAGGAVGTGGNRGSNGGNSSFGAATAYGGGGGGTYPNGLTGGSGGTGGGGTGLGNSAGGAGNQGYGGGHGGQSALGNQAGGGGGTMAYAGFIGTGDVGAAWGVPGVAYSISGASVYYGGAGAGGYDPAGSIAQGGNGGGGNGASGTTSATAGAANTGGGGGGGSYSGSGATGGSGIVIVKYPSTVTTGTVATGTYTWKLEEGDGSTVLRTTTYDSIKSGSTREVMVKVYTGDTTTGVVVSETKYVYTTTGTLEDLTQVIANPNGGADALETKYEYYANSADLGNYRRIKSVTSPTGNWESYVYFDDWDRRGQIKFRYQPYLGTPSVPDFTGTGVRVAYAYANDPNTDRNTRPLVEDFAVNGVKIRRTTWSYDNSYNAGSIRLKADVDSFWDSGSLNYQRARQEIIDAASGNIDETGEPYLITNPDSSQISYGRTGGSYDSSTKAFTVGSGNDWRELKVHGSSATGTDPAQSSYNGQSFASINLLSNKSTIEVTIRNVAGYVVRTETRVYTGSGTWSSSPVTSEDFSYDLACRLTQRVASNGATTTYSYANGRVDSTVDPTGTETQFTYDALGRVVTSIKKGAVLSGPYDAQGDITTGYTYDGANRVTRTVSSGGALSLTSTADYDKAGRIIQSVAPGSYTTGIVYTSGGKIVTTTLPGAATKATEVYPDGQLKSVTGSAVVQQDFSYSVDGTTGFITRQVKFGGSATALVKATADWLGRTISEVKPGWNGSDVARSWTYTSSGQLTKLSQPGVADTLYTYDTMGVLKRECLDVSSNGAIDDMSTDRITDHAWTFTNSSGWWLQQTDSVYATASSGTATQVKKVEKRIDLPTNRLSHTKSYDIFGNVTEQWTDMNRAGKLVTSTTDAPDSTTDTVQVSYNGLLMAVTDTAAITVTYAYDDLGRQISSIDPRKGADLTVYRSVSNQVEKYYDPYAKAQLTGTPSFQPTVTNHYDDAGRVDYVIDALNKTAYTGYTTRNEVEHQWGDTTYPVEYAYDAWGHRITMKTYRGGSGWTGSTWSSSPGTADTTMWNFQEATGLLSSKVSAYGTADAKTVSYTYTQAGQIKTREWARILTGTTHVKTTYDYSSTTAELSSVDYNDSTTDLAYTYNRLGNIAQVTDATGVRTLNYNLSGTLELQSEDLSSFFISKRITYPRSSSGVIGRPTGVQLGSSGSPTADQSIAYGYDTYGRFNSLAGGSQTFSYGYETNSNLIATITNSGANYTDTRTYDSKRDWIDNRKTEVSSATPALKAEFAYIQDNLGRITTVAKTGQVFNVYGNTTQGLDTTYGYDDRSQITSEQTKLGGSGSVLSGRDEGFAYDTIGNRASSAGTTHNVPIGGTPTALTSAYTTNALNQYEQRTNSGYFDVAGALAGGTVQVSNPPSGPVDTAARHGAYFFDAYPLSTTGAAVFATLSVTDGGTPSPLDAFVTATPEIFTYDADGNLTGDGRWAYYYDAENRLAWIEPSAAAVNAGIPFEAWSYYYDYLGRRAWKHKCVWDSISGTWQNSSPIKQTRYVYDGWNLVAEIDGVTGNVTKNYFWSLDISGSLQGAGGVGGLLMIKDSSGSYLPAYDGNGNIHGLIKASDGSLAAAYEYDAFGNTLRESGSYAAANSFRFSTKYTDLETGLVYYGLRYYSPTLGRFINKDPIEESGGLNLYGFCMNNGVNRVDYLGNMGLQSAAISMAEALAGSRHPYSGIKNQHVAQVLEQNYEESQRGIDYDQGGASDPSGLLANAHRVYSASELNGGVGYMTASTISISSRGGGQVTSTMIDSVTGKVIDPRTTTSADGTYFPPTSGFGNSLAPNSGAGANAPFAALFVTNGGTVVGPYAEDSSLTYVGNRINFSAVVTGVPANDIEIRQTYVGATATDVITGNQVVTRRFGDLDGVVFNGTNFRSGNGYSVFGDPPVTITLTPSMTVSKTGAVIFQFYDGPGQAWNPNTLSFPRTNNQTITTTILQQSTGTVLNQQTWNTSSTLKPDGSGSTTFRQYPF